MQYFLMKSEPDAFSWDDLCRKGPSMWDGVRNYTARNFLRAMQVGDLAIFYHSNIGKACVGICQVVQPAYTDPTAGEDLRWSVVDVQAVVPLQVPVTLEQIKQASLPGGPLEGIRMLRENRLSVVPLQVHEWQWILQMAQTADPTSE